VSIGVPASYRATIRGEVRPDAKDDPVPVAMTFMADNAVREMTVPAYSFFLASVPAQTSAPLGRDANEQVVTLATAVTAESIRTTPLWIEMFPPPLRWQALQAVKEKLFPANAAVTLVLLGLASLASVTMAPRKRK
jgi:hypothetical protein